MARKKAPNIPSTLLRVGLLIALGALLLYAPTLSYQFTFDDGPIVAQNPAVQQWGLWQRVFWSDYWPDSHSGLYRPFTILSFALERQIHGDAPSGFHLTNVLLHAACSLMVFLVTWELSGVVWAASSAALLFAVHPLHTEVVAGIVGRSELLSTLLSLLAFWAWIRRFRIGRMRERTAYLLALVSFLLALGSKENVAVLPVIIALWELIFKEDGPAGTKVFRLATNRKFLGLVGVLLLFILVRSAVLGGFRSSFQTTPLFVENPLVRESSSSRSISALANQWHALKLHLFPWPLLADYSYDTLPIRKSWSELPTIGFLAAVLSGLVLWIPRKRALQVSAFAATWYLFSILPTSNLFLLIGTVFAERLFYFPSVGFCMLVAFVSAPLFPGGSDALKLPETHVQRASLAVLAAIVLLLSLATIVRLPAWADDLTLFKTTVERAPGNVKARLRLGDALVQNRLWQDGIHEYRQALSALPSYGAAWANMVVPLTRVRRFTEATESGEKARALFKEENPLLLYNLALAYNGAGNTVRFLEYIQRCLDSNPRDARAHLQLGTYYFQQVGDREEAIRHLDEALRLDPSLDEAGKMRALVEKTGRTRGR